MSYEFYKILHIAGLASLFIGLISLIQTRLSGEKPARINFIYHGAGLLLLLVSGFGMLARLRIITELPSWVLLKLLIWLSLGALLVLIKRKPDLGNTYKLLLLVLTVLAAYLAIMKI